ncbi:MAG: hypothetical protein LC798_10965 [Chloroflexi bacterium]|nr:hypothetical protein [Chloroflexota bacterium]
MTPTMVDCPDCGGSGKVEDRNTPCEAVIVLGVKGHEELGCWYQYKHGGDHTALTYEACPECGGRDEHSQECQSNIGEPEPFTCWVTWADNAENVTEQGLDLPDPPWRWRS